MKKYKAKNGKTQFMPSISWVQHACENETNEGFCLACGAEGQAAEPDARRYMCDACGEHKVYGAEELLLMGLYHEGVEA